MVDDDMHHLERELGIFLRRATASSSAMARMVHPELDPAAYELLALIAGTPDVRASDIAAYIGVGRGTMSRQLARLGELGLISRAPDPEDFRGQLLSLTSDGYETLQTAQSGRRTFLGRALDEWEPEQIAALTLQLGRLNRDLTTAWSTRPPAQESTGA